MPAYPTSDLLKLITEASKRANLNPEVPQDLKRLHRAVNEGRETADRIGDTYIYKKIYSRRKQATINLDTRLVDLIAQYVGYDTFSEFQASLDAEAANFQRAGPEIEDSEPERTAQPDEAKEPLEPIPAVVLGSGEPPRTLRKQEGLVWQKQPTELPEAPRLVIWLSPEGPNDLNEEELDQWDDDLRQAFKKQALLLVAEPNTLEAWLKELPCVGWHNPISLQETERIQAFLKEEYHPVTPTESSAASPITSYQYGNDNQTFNNPQGPITINHNRK